ncbi:ribosome maturation factor RimP [Endomicrobiia bacterium]|nr:ribosome maturation factor RimP [Endomicrobiia bacterium]GHT66236.1 ribosome maturation factor RimP [Endomicrobiia bacterium]GHT71093.1 ribosome maturation factor RimP [Endomicrobiia bacterium]GHT75448.1 ribosome maturation factor RimP [Endomicrobiia bacterium]
MKMDKIQKIESLLEMVTVQEKVELVDVQYVKENGDWIVRIFIDKDGGVTMSDCENISHVFSAVLCENDTLKDSDILEISSPGLNRILKKEESFKRFIGSNIRIQTFEAINNQKNFLGKLVDFKDGKVKMDDATNGIVEINFLDIKKANIETDV